MITYRKPDETPRDYFKREHALCSERVEKYYVLQSLRRDQGYFGAAKFYQSEAKRWHDRMIEAHREATKPTLRILNVVTGLDLVDRSAVARGRMTA